MQGSVLLDVLVMVAVDKVSRDDELLYLVGLFAAKVSWLSPTLFVGVVDGDELSETFDCMGLKFEDRDEFKKVDALDEVFLSESSWFKLVELILCRYRCP